MSGTGHRLRLASVPAARRWTRIELQVTVPDSYGFDEQPQRDVIAFSVGRLARLAEEIAA